MNNHRTFGTPFQIENPQDFKDFVDELNNTDLTMHPDIKESSEWTIHDVTNLTFYMNHLAHAIQSNTKKARCRNGVITVPSSYNQCFFAYLIRRANPNFKDRMVLDLSETEGGAYLFSNVYDLKQYAQSFKCGKCGQLWDRAWKCECHESTCDTMTVEIYPEGHFQINLN